MYMAVSFETVFVLLASGSLLYLSPLSGENNHISIWKFGKDRSRNQEPRTRNHESRTRNQEPRTKNQEPRNKKVKVKSRKRQEPKIRN